MNGCLACKACATQCPVKVDIPHLRSEFLEQYHGRYRRPLKDYFVAALEWILRVLVIWPKLSNALMNLSPMRWFLRRIVGMVDTPLLAEKTFDSGLVLREAEYFDPGALARLSESEKVRVVLLAQDAFTTFYEPEVALATYDLLKTLGKRPVFLPYRENGKALHVKGFLRWFRSVARRNTEFYKEVARLGFPIVGIEPAVTLTYRDEYPHELKELAEGLRVQLLQEYLHERRAEFSDLRVESEGAPSYQLFGHCTERTFEPKSQEMWRAVFEELGATIQVEQTGCCGMCGVFGHEAEHYEESRGVFEMSWQKHLPEGKPAQGRVLATGHSCRSQVKRFSGFVPKHPAQVLLAHLNRG